MVYAQSFLLTLLQHIYNCEHNSLDYYCLYQENSKRQSVILMYTSMVRRELFWMNNTLYHGAVMYTYTHFSMKHLTSQFDLYYVRVELITQKTLINHKVHKL